MESDFCNCLRIDDLLTPLSKKQKKNGRTANKLKKKKNEMNCVLLCKNRIALRLILTYDCDSEKRKGERE